MTTSKSNSVPLKKAHGVTTAERYLSKLCEGTFLSMWSYPGIYRDQGKKGGGHGKEVCDLLVVFDDHIIIFSDKDCKFPNTGNLEVDWCRWYRKAVRKSAEQIWGAERWINTFPHRLFIDRSCTKPFPVALPDLSSAKFHRVVVAHDASQRCQEELGGSGSLMIDPDMIGDAHCASLSDGGRPFTIGQVDPTRGFVHVLDDTSLDIVMRTQDTITDFVNYLERKEQFILSGRLAMAAGEEDLLAYYLQNLNEEDAHDFVFPDDIDGVILDEGFWEEFTVHPQRKAQLAANRISYSWDALIEKFSFHIMTGTQHFTNHPSITSSEKALRFLARESRIRRRLLAKSLIDMLERTPENFRATRISIPTNPNEPFYVFLLLPLIDEIPYEKYREVRRYLLESCCLIMKFRYPRAQDIIGIATETNINNINRSEDLFYFDARDWTEEMNDEAKQLQRELGLLTSNDLMLTSEKEYPDLTDPSELTRFNFKRVTKYPRNKPCPCGSGIKYKVCCGKPRGRKLN